MAIRSGSVRVGEDVASRGVHAEHLRLGLEDGGLKGDVGADASRVALDPVTFVVVAVDVTVVGPDFTMAVIRGPRSTAMGSRCAVSYSARYRSDGSWLGVCNVTLGIECYTRFDR